MNFFSVLAIAVCVHGYGPRNESPMNKMFSTKEAEEQVKANSTATGSNDKMFFWPIWTKESVEQVNTKSLMDSLKEWGQQTLNKYDSTPSEAHSTRSADQESANAKPESPLVAPSEDKMFFWPIWTKSDSQVSEKPLIV
jgi:hypothetical protein